MYSALLTFRSVARPKVQPLAWLLAALLLVACGGHTKVTPAAAPAAQPQTNRCVLWLQAFGGADRVTPSLQSTRAGLAGNFEFYTEPVCLRHASGPFLLPDTFQLHATAEQEMCREETDQPTSGIDCAWNLKFRNKYPASFALFTGVEGESLSKYVRVVRVFRNGEQVFRWSASTNPSQLLIIPGKELLGDLMPHLAPIDLRIVPRDVPEPPGIEDAVISRRKSHIEERLQTALSALLSAPALREGALGCELGKFEALAKETRRAAECLLPDRNPTLCAKPDQDEEKCATSYEMPKVEISGAAGKALSEALAQLKASTQAAFEKARDDVLAEATTLDGNAQKGLDEFKKWVNEHWDEIGLPAAELERLLVQTDKLMMSAVGVVDATEALVAGLAADVREIAKDDERAQAFYNHVAHELGETAIFEPRTDNPPALEGEWLLPMKYSDRWQTFWLAPWNGVAMRPQDSFATDFSAVTIVPMIDLVGERFQCGVSRFADFRLAFGIAGFSETVEDDSFFRAALQANLSAGTLHLGLGYILTKGGGLGGLGEYEARLRMLVGVDLIKLVTGRNLGID